MGTDELEHEMIIAMKDRMDGDLMEANKKNVNTHICYDWHPMSLSYTFGSQQSE